MKTVLISYIIIINLIGFFLMGIDKRKARRNLWRISERTLFIFALIFGSIGVLIGMYVFRHKTRHLKFVIGIPAILFLQIALVCMFFTWHNKNSNRPTKTVQNELSLIQELDTATIQSFISYENLTNSDLSSGTINDETAEAVSLFFQNFKYHILNETIEDDTATVSVNITNIDTEALAHDLCRAMLEESMMLYPKQLSTTTSDYYRLLRDTLSNHSYETIVTPAYFHLKKTEKGWNILSDRTLEDELVSGFITYMNDAHLLSAYEVLEIQLNAFRDLSAAQWMDYLSVNDIFATYNTDYYAQIDQAFIEQVAAAYDFQIIRCSENGEKASAVVRIFSIDMPSVLANYKKYLLEYAATSNAIRDDDVTFSNKTAGLLLRALEENKATASTDIDLTLKNNGNTWEVLLDSTFTNALMGDMDAAIEVFNSATPDEEVQYFEPRY